MREEETLPGRLEYLSFAEAILPNGILRNIGNISNTKNISVMKKEEPTKYGVFPIVNGCSTEIVFEGTNEECVEYSRKNFTPGKGDCIICPLD